MSSHRVKRSAPCAHENCGTRRFYIGEDGFTYCEQGHRQSERGAAIAEDTGELTITGRKQRLVDSDAESVATSRAGLTGPQAVEHHLLCLQLVLWKQSRWLVDVQKLPAEFEGLVKGLWALRLRKLQHAIPHDSDTSGDEQSQMYSSQSGGDTRSESDEDESRSGVSNRKRRSKSRDRQRQSEGLQPVDTIALCYVGALLLRIPVSVGDLTQWINDGKLLYYQTSKEVPPTLRDRLPGRFQELLDPRNLLKAETLHRTIAETTRSLQTGYGMAVPAINHTLLLYRWMCQMALPLEVFAATQRLGRMLDADFAFTLIAGQRRLNALGWPEVHLMTLIVIAVKLFFPMDDIERYPRSSNDASALGMDWQEWVKDMSNDKIAETRDEPQHTPLSFQDAFDATEADCLAMGEENLDDYLDWYEQHLASEHVRERGRAGRDADLKRSLMRLFPTQSPRKRQEDVGYDGSRATKSGSAEKITWVQSRLRTKQVVPDEPGADLLNDVHRVGSFYRRFRKVEDIDDHVHPAMRKLYELAGDLAGVNLQVMIRAVFLVEKRLEKCEKSEGDNAR